MRGSRRDQCRKCNLGPVFVCWCANDTFHNPRAPTSMSIASSWHPKLRKRRRRPQTLSVSRASGTHTWRREHFRWHHKRPSGRAAHLRLQPVGHGGTLEAVQVSRMENETPLRFAHEVQQPEVNLECALPGCGGGRVNGTAKGIIGCKRSSTAASIFTTSSFLSGLRFSTSSLPRSSW